MISLSHLSTLPHAERYSEIDALLSEPARTAMFNVLTRMPGWRKRKADDVRAFAAEQARVLLAGNPDARWMLRVEGYRRLADAVED